MAAKKKSKDIQSELLESAHNVWLAGLGAVALAEDEGGKLFQSLVEKGRTFEERGKGQVEKARGAVSGARTVAESYWETFERTLDEKLTGALHRVGVPTKNEIDTLTKRVEELTTSIENLHRSEAKK